MKYIQKILTSGYLLIILLIGCIAYTWFHEWRMIEVLETDNKRTDRFRKEINNIHVQLIDYFLLGETVLEWDSEDLEYYHSQRMTMDSMLCYFKTLYSAERIDSVRHLLEDKERQIRQIVYVLNEQQSTNRKIANQVPAIAQKSVQEQPKKSKRKCFMNSIEM